MVAIPTWLVGKGVTAVTVTPQTVSAAGVLADTTPVASLVGFWDSVQFQSENTVEMIQASDQRRENDVVTGSRTTCTVTEILKTNDSSGTPTNLLANLAYGSADYFKISLARAGRSFTFYALFRSYREELNRGKITGVAEFTMVDPGASNPVYT